MHEDRMKRRGAWQRQLAALFDFQSSIELLGGGNGAGGIGAGWCLRLMRGQGRGVNG